MNIIEEIEKQQQRDDIPEFSPGDTVAVQVRIKEGSRERLRIFEGIVKQKRIEALTLHSLLERYLMEKVSKECFKLIVNSLQRSM